MSLAPTNYTPPGGYTPQAQAVASGQPNATNTVPPPGGSPADFPSDQALQGSYAGANQQLAGMETPTARQGYMDNSNLPAMQTNYDQLARQLFDYDQGVLQPQFAGQNPGTPSDAPAFGRVDASPLGMTPGSAGLPATQGLFNLNPTYAYSAQTAQGNNIVDLLNTLNGSIGKEFSMRTGQYGSTVQSQKDLVDSIFKVMGLKSDATLKQAEMQNQRDIQAMQDKNSQIVEGIRLGVLDPTTGLPYGQGKEPGAKGSPQTPQAYADSLMGGYVKWADVPDSLKPAVTNIVKKQGGKIQTIVDAYNALDNSSNILNDLTDKWSKMNSIEQHIPGQLLDIAPGLSPTRTSISTTFVNSLEPELRKAVAGGRITQQEFNWIKNSVVPTSGDSYESAMAKLNAVKAGINLKRKNPGYVIGSNPSQSTNTTSEPASTTGFTIMTGPDGKQWNVPSDKVGVFKQNGYK